MTEAWLLLEEVAIRSASGNPSGRYELRIPPVGSLEQLADPKQTLRDLLRAASELNGRRREKIRISQAVQSVAEFVEDSSPLRDLPAFAATEESVSRVVAENGWA
jgi:hypothetical protein